MPWLAAWTLFKRFWWVLPLVILLWCVYSWVWDRGYHSRDAEVVQLQAEAKKWKAGYDAQAKTISNERTAHEQALDGLQKDQAVTVAALKGELDEARSKAAQVRVVIQHDVERITPQIDAAYPLPYAFVRVHNDAALADGAAQGLAVSVPHYGDDAAASGVAASAAARVIADNYAECTARGGVIKAWQDWYIREKAAWEKAAKTQATFTAVQPPQ